MRAATEHERVRARLQDSAEEMPPPNPPIQAIGKILEDLGLGGLLAGLSGDPLVTQDAVGPPGSWLRRPKAQLPSIEAGYFKRRKPFETNEMGEHAPVTKRSVFDLDEQEVTSLEQAKHMMPDADFQRLVDDFLTRKPK